MKNNKTHIPNMKNSDNPKLKQTYTQLHEQKQQDKRDREVKDRIRHPLTIEYLSEHFPSYPQEP